jgi:thiamine pyrophosphokinase
MKAIIITPCLSGSIKNTVKIENGDLVICADNSFSRAISEGITPDLIIGDFDTGAPTEMPDGIEIIRFPIEKDDADTMLCVKEAAARGFAKITVVGGLSGRLDHTFANIQMLAYGASNGLEITVTDAENEIFLMKPGTLHLKRKSGYSLSLFSYCDTAEGITISGVKYPLTNGTLTSLFPLGLSNEITDEEAQITLTKGWLLIISSKL